MVFLNLLFFICFSFTVSIIGIVTYVSIFHHRVFLLAKSILTYRLKIAMSRIANKSKLMFSPDRQIEEEVQNRVIELKFPEFSPYHDNYVECKNQPGNGVEEVENLGKHENCNNSEGLGQPIMGEEVD
jgi:hypothetical protein